VAELQELFHDPLEIRIVNLSRFAVERLRRAPTGHESHQLMRFIRQGFPGSREEDLAQFEDSQVVVAVIEILGSCQNEARYQRGPHYRLVFTERVDEPHGVEPGIVRFEAQFEQGFVSDEGIIQHFIEPGSLEQLFHFLAQREVAIGRFRDE